jgi:hypothetical protein
MIFFTSCNEPKKNAADSIKAIYELYILDDTEGITALGMAEEDINAARKTYDESLRETIRAKFSASGQEIEEAVLDELCEARSPLKNERHCRNNFRSAWKGDCCCAYHLF